MDGGLVPAAREAVLDRRLSDRRLDRVACSSRGCEHGRLEHVTSRPAGHRRDCCHPKPVLGQSAGLVGADDRRLPGSFDRRHPAHDRAARRHVPGSERKGDRDRRRQAFRDRCNRHRNADEKRFLSRRPLGPENPAEENGDRASHDGHRARERAETELERRRQPADALHQPGQASDLAARSGRRHQRCGMSARGSRAREDHRLALRRRSIRRYRLDALRDRHGFAGQHRLVDLEAADLDEPGIGGDPVPRVHEEQVAGNDLRGGDLRLVPPSDHRRGASDTVAESEHGALRSGLLHEAEDPVQHDDGRDHHRLETLADHERDSGGGREERHQRILELTEGDSRYGGRFTCWTRFGPCSRSRAAASSELRPSSTLVSSSAATSATGLACGGRVRAGSSRTTRSRPSAVCAERFTP